MYHAFYYLVISTALLTAALITMPFLSQRPAASSNLNFQAGSIQGMEMIYANRRYPLNFKQQQAVTHLLNSCLEGKAASLKDACLFGSLAIYKFEQALEAIDFYQQDNSPNLIVAFTDRENSPLFLDASSGKLKELLLTTFDRD